MCVGQSYFVNFYSSKKTHLQDFSKRKYQKFFDNLKRRKKSNLQSNKLKKITSIILKVNFHLKIQF